MNAEAFAREAVRLMEAASFVFWDFDGVVKDSVAIKSDAFERLFLPYGNAIAARVRDHHEAHGGMSRYDKMPLYLGWAGESADEHQVREFCKRFSQLVMQAVIQAPWVPGVQEYLHARHKIQTFVLVTATPHAEIVDILDATRIAHCFRKVYGAPIAKAAAIREVLQSSQCPASEALLVGDSQSDLAAAEANGLLFILRCTPLNRDLQQTYSGPRFDELTHE